MRDRAAHAGFSVAAYRRIGVLEVAGAVGLLIGLIRAAARRRWPASGCCSCSAGAVVTHLRNGDGPREVAPAVVCGVLVAGLPRRPDRSVAMSAGVPVVIVGAGPTGLTAATLLGQYGVECLVLERWEVGLPAAAGGPPRRRDLPDRWPGSGSPSEFAAISRPCHGLRLLDRNMRVLAEFRRGTATGRHGYPEANMFDQPELEDDPAREPRSGTPTVTLRGNSEVTGADPGRRRPGAGRRHRPGHRPRRVGPRRVRPRLRRRQQPDQGHDRRHHAGPAARAALAGRRRGHRRRPRPVGGRAPALRPGTAPAPTCGSARPATAGSSGCGPGRPPTTSATWPGCTR